jgi:hypothetical protein
MKTLEKKFRLDSYGRRIKSRRELYNYKGHGQIYGKYWYKLQKDAEDRGYTFEITIQQAWARFLFQKGLCAISGEKLRFPSKSGGSDGTASLDRIDSIKGYKLRNIQWVHKDINRMKGNKTDKEFINICRKVAKFNANSN